MHSLIISILLLGSSSSLFANSSKVSEKVDEIEPSVIQWRHHLHQHPELSNREFETAKYIEKHLRSLGLDVATGVAKTGGSCHTRFWQAWPYSGTACRYGLYASAQIK